MPMGQDGQDSTGPAAGSDALPASPPVVLWTNLITLAGLLLVATGLLLLVTFWLFMLLSPAHSQNEYLNIIGFLVLPGILVAGLTLCPVGIMIRRWRYRRFGATRYIPVKTALAFLGITFFLMLPVLGVSGYHGYHYTESTEFCGSCHAVMEPQFVAYHRSPHARITCAECHIGPGASPFVKSKLSGTRQVFKVMLGTYPRPIPPAIHQLRPARETCEQCHWPDQFFGSQLKQIARYSLDEHNTRHQLEILLKVGGENKYLGRSEGIHAHMLGRVEYVAEDAELQSIPWVRYQNSDGSHTIYRSDGKPAHDPPPAGSMRQLDCMDCHNRVGHSMQPPQEAVDGAMEARLIDASLPYIKRQAVTVLAEKYPDKETAVARIERDLRSFYAEKYPAVAQQKQDQLNRTIEAIQNLYVSNIFPYMKADWATYPDNIGHRNSAGCFRCHDGYHVNAEGVAISSDCNSCHTFLNRQRGEENVIIEGKFQHALKLHDSWEDFGPHKNLRCDQCHNGGLGNWGVELLSDNCGDCHSSGRWLEMKGKGRYQETHTRPAH